MRKSCLYLFLFLGVLVMPVGAAEIRATDSLIFTIKLEKGWTLHQDDPPESLVKEIARHLAHEPAAADATAEQIERVARKRLGANEAIIYHAATGSHLDIDFSPLAEGENAPSARTLKNSAEYAAQSLASEADVTAVDSDISAVDIEGVETTYLLTANYLQHDQPMTFLGYVGYVADSWFFLYFTAPGKDPQSLLEMQSMLKNSSVSMVK